MAEGKGLYATLADGLMKALSGAFIAVLGAMWKSNEEEKQRLKDEISVLKKNAEARRRGDDPAERDRLRELGRDKGS